MKERAYIVHPVIVNGRAGWDYRIDLEASPEEEAAMPRVDPALVEEMHGQMAEVIESLSKAPKFANRDEALESAIPCAATAGLPLEIHNEQGELVGIISLEESQRVWTFMKERMKDPNPHAPFTFVEEA